MNNTFNMKDLSDAVAEKFGLPRVQGIAITRFVFDTIKKEMAGGKQVRLHRFGTLEARSRAAGVARNPVTGARIVVPSRRVAKLVPSPHLKAQLAEGEA